ncbi:hypothetical protein N9043_00720 [bacterium]|nr:hypothetical protein [bacterium]
MNSRNFTGYNHSSCNTCNVCKEPEPKCGCKPTKAKMKDIQTKVFDCKHPAYFNKGECAAFEVKSDCGDSYWEYYKSNRDANNIPPNHPPTDPNDPYWLGPFDICDIFGNTGSTGAQGPQGVQGIKGDAGTIGPQGVQGNNGAQGPTGAQGFTGNAGSQGVVGAQGVQGFQGVSGATGAQGIAGEQGVEGSQGVAGGAGVQGGNGAQGLQGVQGESGAEGVQGVNGDQGVSGVQGAIGSQGSVGSQGVAGINGAQGAQGVQGLPYQPDQEIAGIENYTCPATGTSSVLDILTGTIYFCNEGELTAGNQFGQGPQGNVGSQGVTGQNGAQGASGLQGVQGSSGVQGAQGNVGAQGVSGVQGASGGNGSQGVAGQIGAQGVQGARGQTGAQGNAGIQGVQGSEGVAGQTGAQGSVGAQGQTGIQGLQGSNGAQGVQGVQGSQGIQGEIGVGVQGPIGGQGPQGEFGGPAGAQGEKGDTGSQGPQGNDGKDYDPNCQAPVVVDILCANPQGNLTLVFDEVDGTQDTQEMPVAVFKPTNRDLLSAVEHTNPNTNEKYWSTTNHIDSNITWFSKPTVGMTFILTDFKAGEMTDFNKQAIRFDVIDMNGGCLGHGVWELLIECDNCNCTIPTLLVETDCTGKECAVWNDGKGNIVKLALCSKDACGTIDKYPSCDPLLAKKWEDNCPVGVEMGYYTFEDGYYLNEKDGNTARPDSLDGWYGPYNSYQLVQKHIEQYTTASIGITVNNILKMKGLI